MDKTAITASELKAHCAEILRRVERNRTPLTLTKRGRPVARIVPFEDEPRAEPFGFAKGSISVLGDVVAPIDVAWEAGE